MKGKVRAWFGMRPQLSFAYYLQDFVFRKLLRQNKGVTWAVHYTSTIRCPERITRGKEVFPGDSPGNYINALNGISIGDYTNLGPNVGLLSTNHDFYDNDTFTKGKPIKIGNFCWIGMGAVILPEVELGDFTIVGANAVVTKSFSDGYAVIAGNPAKVIRKLDADECAQVAASKR